MTAIANTKVQASTTSVISGKERTTVTFFDTPVMSTYLLAFIVSKYNGNINADQTFGVYARPEAYNYTNLALTFGQEMLFTLGEYTGINYYTIPSITKLDMAVSSKVLKKVSKLTKIKFLRLFLISPQAPWRTGG